MPTSNLYRPTFISEYLRTPGLLNRDATWCNINPMYRKMIAEAARELLQQPERLADLVRYGKALFGPNQWNPNEWKDIPRNNSLGERFFLLLPLLQHLTITRQWYAARGIPENILRDTLADIQIWIETDKQKIGLARFTTAGWLREDFCGRVIRLGRLQFQPTTFQNPFIALAHRQSGKIAVVACGNRSITQQGIFADSEGASDKTLTLVYSEVADEVRRAHLVQRNGTIALTPTDFSPGCWEKKLTAGDSVLALHIPAGESLNVDACRDSFQQAATFFPRYFSTIPTPRAVTCNSWLFYPELCDILPSDANIVRFQKAFLCFPSPGANANQTYERVFAPYGRAITREKLKSTLQHRLFDHIEAGHVPISGNGLILPPFENWGL